MKSFITKYIEFYTYDNEDSKFFIDWYFYKDFVFSKSLLRFDENKKPIYGYEFSKRDVETWRKTPQYRRIALRLGILSFAFQVNIRLKKTGMSLLHKVPLENK